MTFAKITQNAHKHVSYVTLHISIHTASYYIYSRIIYSITVYDGGVNSSGLTANSAISVILLIYSILWRKLRNSMLRVTNAFENSIQTGIIQSYFAAEKLVRVSPAGTF